VSDDAMVAYRAMTQTQLRKVLLVEYRCARDCLLLHVYASPRGPTYYRPALHVSKKMQFRTGMAEVGRIPETAGLLSDLSTDQFVWGDASNSILIGCPHCIGVHFPAEVIKAAAGAATPGNPVKDHTFWMTDHPPK
jgi:hypothetical protein